MIIKQQYLIYVDMKEGNNVSSWRMCRTTDGDVSVAEARTRTLLPRFQSSAGADQLPLWVLVLLAAVRNRFWDGSKLRKVLMYPNEHFMNWLALHSISYLMQRNSSTTYDGAVIDKIYLWTRDLWQDSFTSTSSAKRKTYFERSYTVLPIDLVSCFPYNYDS